MGSYKEQQRLMKPKVRALYEEGLTCGRIAKILSMNKTTVYRWIAIFAEENKEAMPAKKPNKTTKPVSASKEVKAPSTSTTSTSSAETPEEKIARLERELRVAQLRADFYDEMINVAEAKFDIQIRKKAGAKR